MVTLYGLIHCATEITTEPSKSSSNTPIEEKEKHRDNKGGEISTDMEEQAKSKEETMDLFPKSFIISASAALNSACSFVFFFLLLSLLMLMHFEEFLRLEKIHVLYYIY